MIFYSSGPSGRGPHETSLPTSRWSGPPARLRLPRPLSAALGFKRWRTDVELNPKGSISGRSIVIAGLTLHLILASADIAGAQQAAIRRVGVFSDAVRMSPLAPEWLEAFRGGLREHGWVEGRNVAIDFQ